MITGNLAEKVFKTLLGMVQVEGQAVKVVGAGLRTRRAAAGKGGFRRPGTAFKLVVFEKRNGQVGNIFQGTDFFRFNTQVPDEVFVNNVVLSLESKELQRTFSEGAVVCSVYL